MPGSPPISPNWPQNSFSSLAISPTRKPPPRCAALERLALKSHSVSTISFLSWSKPWAGPRNDPNSTEADFIDADFAEQRFPHPPLDCRRRADHPPPLHHRRRVAGIHLPRSRERGRGANAARRAARAHGAYRHGHAAHVRNRVSGEGQTRPPPQTSRRDDRPRIGGNRRPGDEARRLRLHFEALCSPRRTAPVPSAYGR